MTLYFQKYFFESTGHVLLSILKLKDIISYLYVYVHSSILSNYIWAFFIHFIHIVDPKWIYILWPFTKSPKTKDGNNVYVLYGHINSGYLNMRYCWINSYIYRQYEHVCNNNCHLILHNSHLLIFLGTLGVLKLTDFGFAKETLSKETLQTPCYTPYYVGKHFWV